jgi:hypothetical protein
MYDSPSVLLQTDLLLVANGYVGQDCSLARPNCIWSVAIHVFKYMVRLTFTTGWDSSFEYEGQTYAEMPKEKKNKISHRGKALDKLKEWLKENTE